MARTPARLPNGTRLSDHVTLGVLTATVPARMIDVVLGETGRQSRRQRQLPARLVVYYVMALALYAQASYGEVLRCLLEGVRWLCLRGADVALADKSAITKARARLGAEPLKALFARVASPLAAADTPGAWYQGRRLVSLDGTTIDLPDTPALEQRFGRPPASRGESSFPQLRVLTLTETGTHAIFAVAVDRCQWHAAPCRWRPEPFVRVGDHQLDAAQAPSEQALEEAGPERLRLGRAKPQAHDLPLALGAHRDRDYGGD